MRSLSHIPAPSSSVAATLQVIVISCCQYLRSIDFVRSCVQLRCLWMPWCHRVKDMSPLGACSETLEELWMAKSYGGLSLAPLAACPRLRKLDLRGCSSALINQVEGLQLTCTQLADPQSVVFEGLVHELQPFMPPSTQQLAADTLGTSAASSARNQAAIVAARAVPALQLLLESDSLYVRVAATGALHNLGA
jgi:hypothetical protein